MDAPLKQLRHQAQQLTEMALVLQVQNVIIKVVLLLDLVLEVKQKFFLKDFSHFVLGYSILTSVLLMPLEKKYHKIKRKKNYTWVFVFQKYDKI